MIDDIPGHRPEVAKVFEHRPLRPRPPALQQGAGDRELEIGADDRDAVLLRALTPRSDDVPGGGGAGAGGRRRLGERAHVAELQVIDDGGGQRPEAFGIAGGAPRWPLPGHLVECELDSELEIVAGDREGMLLAHARNVGRAGCEPMVGRKHASDA